MSFFTLIIMYTILIITFIHTISYSVYVWKQKNKSGAVAVAILAFSALLMPIILVNFRR
ncbi:MAG: hypothetical protein ACM3KR_02710 [Deltaproteobacteria bacterium]